MATDLPELIVDDADAWRSWLGHHHADSTGVWLVLAKKGTTEPAQLTYDQAAPRANRAAQATFACLTSRNRYALLYRDRECAAL